MLDWRQIDHVFLDMDGTLLDLHYDNTVFSEHFPNHYATKEGIPVSRAREHLFSNMHKHRGTIQFYDLEYWSKFSGVDVMLAHKEAAHLIQWRDHAKEFIRAVRQHQIPALLVTNAHPNSISIKDKHTDVVAELDGVVSAHDFGHPKESQQFWRAFSRQRSFSADRALFIDDNADVLDSAAEFGIGHLLTITQPDSQKPERLDLNHQAINDFGPLLNSLPNSHPPKEKPSQQHG